MADYRISEYYAENFKRLRLVHFEPKGRITAFTGRNDQGKSSALEAIPYVLGGKKWSPEMPKRKGAQHMKVRLTLGDLVVTRTESGLRVETAPGVKAWGTPQAMLDSLFDELAFDPMEFIRMKPEQQVEMLKKCVKLDEDLDALTRQNKEDFDTRREVNREVARLQAEIFAIPVQDGLPKEKIDETAIETKIAQANEHNRNMAGVIEMRRQLEQAKTTAAAAIEQNDTFIAQTEATMEQWQKNLEALEHRRQVVMAFLDDFEKLLPRLEDPAFVPADSVRRTVKGAYVDAENYLRNLDSQSGAVLADLTIKRPALEAASSVAPALKEALTLAETQYAAAPLPEVIDTTPLMDELKQAQLTNREIDKRARVDGLKAELKKKSEESAKLTRQMDSREERKAAAIANAKLPIEGLSFTEGEVLFEGIPVQQLGEAKQIKISIALVLARSPKLRLVVIKHGEALDDDSMAELQKMAEEHDFYVWMARVDPSGKVGIYLEDGEVKAINEIN